MKKQRKIHKSHDTVKDSDKKLIPFFKKSIKIFEKKLGIQYKAECLSAKI